MKFKHTKSMSAAQLVRLFLLAFHVFFWSDNRETNIAAARPLNSIQLATGEWDVSIRGGYWMDASCIFPSISRFRKPSTVSKAARKLEFKKKVGEIQPFVRRRPWGSSIDCILSMASDGTFVLAPKYVESTGSDSNSLSNEMKEYKTRNCDWTNENKEINEATRDGLLDIRGSWNVLSNPYCVTDRLYDQVSLLSYPRQRIEIGGEKVKICTAKEEIVETLQLTMNCRMWGRHSRQNARRYRLTHGTLVCKDRYAPWWKPFARPIMGSFSAVRSSNTPKHEGWVDKERFGYSSE